MECTEVKVHTHAVKSKIKVLLPLNQCLFKTKQHLFIHLARI